jgi:hypothetical protein
MKPQAKEHQDIKPKTEGKKRKRTILSCGILK